jgi:hypothetical protein
MGMQGEVEMLKVAEGWRSLAMELERSLDRAVAAGMSARKELDRAYTHADALHDAAQNLETRNRGLIDDLLHTQDRVEQLEKTLANIALVYQQLYDRVYEGRYVAAGDSAAYREAMALLGDNNEVSEAA